MTAAQVNPTPEVTRALIELGADVNQRAGWGRTPLMMAAATNQPPLARMLLEAGADVNARDVNGMTALHAAASSNCADMLELLVAAGAEVDAGAGTKRLVTPLSNTLSDLDAPVAWRFQRKNGEIAAEPCEGDVTVARARVLLEAGADPNVTVLRGPALTYAVRRHKPEIVKLLVEYGADLEVRDASGRTPLLWAGEMADRTYARDKARYPLIRPLVEAGADVNVVARPEAAPQNGWYPEHLSDTPLIQAARRGGVEAARLLLAAGAEIDARNDAGRTALIEAVRARHYLVAELLLDHGADASFRDGAGKTALDYDGYDSPIYARLGGRAIGAGIFALAKRGDATALATALRETDVDPNTVDTFGQTPLTYAAGHNPDPTVVEVLVQRGANVNHPDIYGWTPLMHAVRDNPEPGVAARLLELGARTDLQNDSHQSALRIAGEAGRLGMMRVLLAHGASVREPYLLSETARYGPAGALELLLEQLAPLPRTQALQRELDWALVRTIYCRHCERCKPNPETGEAVREKVRLLLEAGAVPRVEPRGDGSSPCRFPSYVNETQLGTELSRRLLEAAHP